jgi:hypothetical protein
VVETEALAAGPAAVDFGYCGICAYTIQIFQLCS